MKAKEKEVTQDQIEAALAIVLASGQFDVCRIAPAIGTCRTCWGSGVAASGVGGGDYVPCPKCKRAETGEKAPGAKASKYVNENRAEFDLPVHPTHGWCGLGGKPE